MSKVTRAEIEELRRTTSVGVEDWRGHETVQLTNEIKKWPEVWNAFTNKHHRCHGSRSNGYSLPAKVWKKRSLYVVTYQGMPSVFLETSDRDLCHMTELGKVITNI